VPTIANIPITVALGANTYIDQIGMRKTYERLLEHIPEHYSSVQSITVSLQTDYENGEDPRLTIEVARDDPGFPDDADWEWIGWAAENVAPAEYQHFCLWSLRV
jgi:hypothetical protein